MKSMILAAILLTFASSTSAGTLLYTPEVDAVIVEDEGPMMGGGSGAWLIPLALFTLLALVASGANDNPPIVTNGQRP